MRRCLSAGLLLSLDIQFYLYIVKVSPSDRNCQDLFSHFLLNYFSYFCRKTSEYWLFWQLTSGFPACRRRPSNHNVRMFPAVGQPVFLSQPRFSYCTSRSDRSNPPRRPSRPQGSGYCIVGKTAFTSRALSRAKLRIRMARKQKALTVPPASSSSFSVMGIPSGGLRKPPPPSPARTGPATAIRKEVTESLSSALF